LNTSLRVASSRLFALVAVSYIPKMPGMVGLQFKKSASYKKRSVF
jgi:hypothetical protein